MPWAGRSTPELRHDGDVLTASPLGEVRRYDSTQLAYDTVRFAELVSVALWDPDLTLSLLADQAQDALWDTARGSRGTCLAWFGSASPAPRAAERHHVTP
jgi:hypothetical protein